MGAGNSSGRTAGLDATVEYGMDALLPRDESRLLVVLVLWLRGGTDVSVRRSSSK